MSELSLLNLLAIAMQTRTHTAETAFHHPLSWERRSGFSDLMLLAPLAIV